jgi:serine/threonine protein kinase
MMPRKIGPINSNLHARSVAQASGEHSQRLQETADTASSSSDANTPSLQTPNSPTGDLQLDGIIAGRYRVVSVLGQGGGGTVYKVEQIFLQRAFALKTLNSRKISDVAWRRFSKEAKASLLDHPALIKVYDFGFMDDERPFFVMDFVEGETLASLIKKGRLTADTILEIFHQTCLGLGYAHSQGIVHRDIKPSNIMVSNHHSLAEIKVKIVDFGIAKTLAETPEVLALTRTGEVFGTPYYMSPEQCGGTTVDNRSDVYSLGCMLFEAFSGLPPFVGDSALSIMLKHQTQTPITLKEASLGGSFPEGVEKVVSKLLEKDPRMRYQNLFDVASDLTRIRSGDEVQLGRSVADVPEKFPRQIKYALLAAAILICSLVSYFAAYLQMPPSYIKPDTAALVRTSADLIDGAQLVFKQELAPGTDYFGASPSALAHAEAGAGASGKQKVEPSATLNSPSGYFSAPVASRSRERFFRFPQEALGKFIQQPGTEIFALQHGQFSEMKMREHSRIDARGELIVQDFQPLWFEPNVVLSPEDFMRFRPDDLKVLIFSNANAKVYMSDAMLSHITHLKSLAALHLGQAQNLTDKACQSIDQLPNLRYLSISRSQISSAGILRIKALNHLIVFRIKGFKNVEGVLERLAVSGGLQELGLESCSLSSRNLRQIASLRELRHLSIGGNQSLIDADLASLARLKHLRVLEIQSCSNLTPGVMEYLKQLPLTELSLNSNQWSAEAINRLRKTLPRCRINYSDRTGALNLDMWGPLIKGTP